MTVELADGKACFQMILSMNEMLFDVTEAIEQTGSQIRESTRDEYMSSMNHFIGAIGDIDYQTVTIEHGELYRQACLDRGD